jgi:microcystin-dependent protein
MKSIISLTASVLCAVSCAYPQGQVPSESQEHHALQQKIDTQFAMLSALDAKLKELGAKVTLNTPVGTIMAYAGASVPPGWLLCDGQRYSLSKYADFVSLKKLLSGDWGNRPEEDTLVLPDLRGMFIRGVNGDRSDHFRDPESHSRIGIDGVQIGDRVGSYQLDTIQTHSHRIVTTDDDIHGIGVEGVSEGKAIGASDPERADTFRHKYSKWHADTENTLGVETRPKNVSVNYIIKY